MLWNPCLCCINVSLMSMWTVSQEHMLPWGQREVSRCLWIMFPACTIPEVHMPEHYTIWASSKPVPNGGCRQLHGPLQTTAGNSSTTQEGISEFTEQFHSHTFSGPSWNPSLSCIGEGNGNPLQCSCLENPRDGGAWWTAVYGVAQSQTGLNRHSTHAHKTSWAYLFHVRWFGTGPNIKDLLTWTKCRHGCFGQGQKWPNIENLLV